MMNNNNVNNENKSEVAQLCAQIERQYKAAQFAMNAPQIGAAKHRFITRRMAQIGVHQEQLANLIGEEESIGVVIDITNTVSPAQKQEAL